MTRTFSTHYTAPVSFRQPFLQFNRSITSSMRSNKTVLLHEFLVPHYPRCFFNLDMVTFTIGQGDQNGTAGSMSTRMTTTLTSTRRSCTPATWSTEIFNHDVQNFRRLWPEGYHCHLEIEILTSSFSINCHD